MFIHRKYRKLQWFDFLDVMEDVLSKEPPKEELFELMGELRMRKIDCISEGASFKLRAPAERLLEIAKSKDEFDSIDIRELTALLNFITTN